VLCSWLQVTASIHDLKTHRFHSCCHHPLAAHPQKCIPILTSSWSYINNLLTYLLKAYTHSAWLPEFKFTGAVYVNNLPQCWTFDKHPHAVDVRHWRQRQLSVLQKILNNCLLYKYHIHSTSANLSGLFGKFRVAPKSAMCMLKVDICSVNWVTILPPKWLKVTEKYINAPCNWVSYLMFFELKM